MQIHELLLHNDKFHEHNIGKRNKTQEWIWYTYPYIV